MKTSLFSDFSIKGFSHVEIKFSQEEIFKLYHQFDKVCEVFENQYDETILELDKIIEKFISKSTIPFVNDTLKFKYLK